ncbi:MAG: sulfotransferase [Calditrichaeota bacterium]|nr:MAG: sulfotransferase [Calditrichota bacterium]
MNQRPIFILGAHKSGTSLMRSLLDGHPHLFALPLETHYFHFSHHWVDYDYRKQLPDNLPVEKIVKNLCEHVHYWNTVEDPYSDSIGKGLFNEERFHEYLSTLPSNATHKEILEKYFEGIYYSVVGTELPSDIRIVEKSVEHAEFALNLYHFFPKAKFIHIIRNPYSNFVSFRKFKSVKYGYPLLPRILKSLYNSYYYLYKNKELIPEYFILRYEDLVTHPSEVMKKVSDFLELEFKDILLTPTYMGKSWAGNSMSGERFEGISSSTLENWKKNIYPVEVYYLNRLFPFIFQEFNYEMMNINGGFFRRAKGENLKRYIYNRLFRIYL